jgi:hypothetical protein
MSYRNLARAALLLGVVATAKVFASTIESISFTPASDSPFTTSLTESFTTTEATVTGTVSCFDDTPCSGEVGEFFVGLDATVNTPASISISGNLSGDTAGSGDLIIASIPEPFTIPSGDFDKTIFSNEIPPLGMIDTNFTLDLTLPAGETVTLPITLTIGAPVPEPVGQSMVLLGLIGLTGLVRWRSTR